MKTMIVHCSRDTKDDKINLLHLRNTINRDIITAKAPESLQVTGISWTRRGICSTTRAAVSRTRTPTTTKAVQQADYLTLHVNKQDTWYRVSIHGISMENYPDNINGIADLRHELEFQNTGLRINTEPRYMTHPSKRVWKLHSSVIIALTDRELYNQLIKHGALVFGEVYKTGTYLTACRTDQCTKCQRHGHKWQQCPTTKDSGAICAKDHTTNIHFCADCSSKNICAHIAAKCINCEGEHKATERTCPTKQSITVV